MKSILFLLLIICSLFILSCSGSLPSYKEIKTQDEILFNYSEFCSLFEKWYPNFNLVNINWDSLKTAYKPKIESSISEKDFIKYLREILSELQDPHSGVLTPYDNDMLSKMLFHSAQLDLDSIRANYGTLPFIFTLLNDTPIISFVDSTSKEFENGLRIGMRLITINNKSLEDYVKDNFIYGYRTEAKYSALLTFGMKFRPEGQKVQLGFLSDDNHKLNLSCEYSRKNNKYFFNPIIEKYISDIKRCKTLEYGRINNEIGYVSIISFLGKSSYGKRRVLFWHKHDVNKNVEEFENALKELSDTKALIIDVRNNRGGDQTIARTMLSFLIQSPALWYSAKYRDGEFPNNINKLTYSFPDSIYPLREYHKINSFIQYNCEYYKPIIVLQNEGSNSTTEIFLAGMKHIPTATTLGTTSAGSASNPGFFPLPNGLFIRVPRQQTYWDIDKMIEKYGVPPDIEVKTTKNDILLNRDTQLEKAIELLKKNN